MAGLANYTTVLAAAAAASSGASGTDTLPSAQGDSQSAGSATLSQIYRLRPAPRPLVWVRNLLDEKVMVLD